MVNLGEIITVEPNAFSDFGYYLGLIEMEFVPYGHGIRVLTDYHSGDLIMTLRGFHVLDCRYVEHTIRLGLWEISLDGVSCSKAIMQAMINRVREAIRIIARNEGPWGAD